MAWSSVGTPISLTSSWQYTDPISGSFFSLLHGNAPNNAVYQIAQAELGSDSTVTIFDDRILSIGPEADLILFKQPECFISRRLAIRRLPTPLALEDELRNALVPGIFKFVSPQSNYIALAPWTVQISVSDVVTSTIDLTGITQQLTSITQQLDSISKKIFTTSTTTSATSTNAQQSDPNFNNVVALLHMDGSNGNTTFADVKGHSVATNGNPVLSSSQFKFGTTSCYFDGSSALTIPKTVANLTNQDWTFECWLYWLGNSNNNVLFTNYNLPSGNQHNCLMLYADYAGNDAVGFNIPTPTNQWVHYAISYVNSSSKFYGFLNGKLQNAVSLTLSTSDNNFLGGSPGDNNLGNRGLIGYVDEVRITTGIARYSSDFTVPALPFSES